MRRGGGSCKSIKQCCVYMGRSSFGMAFIGVGMENGAWSAFCIARHVGCDFCAQNCCMVGVGWVVIHHLHRKGHRCIMIFMPLQSLIHRVFCLSVVLNVMSSPYICYTYNVPNAPTSYRMPDKGISMILYMFLHSLMTFNRLIWGTFSFFASILTPPCHQCAPSQVPPSSR